MLQGTVKWFTNRSGWDFIDSFHPQMVFLPNLGVNRHCRLCGVACYASAQQLDFLDLGQKSAFVNWKR